MEPVQIERFYLGCLAHASYAVGSEGVAAIIDPQRDVDIYLEAAARQGWKIEHIIETHLHADFVSGHRELAERTGARIYLGAGSGAQFPHVAVKDGDEIQFGQCRFRFLQTPGHTMESICIVMTDLGQPERPQTVFTGDTLFIGDVGRPDLSATHTPQELAAILYQSLHEKLLTLPDDTEIFPAHGAGSLCGRQMSSESSSTIGKQRQSNYALLARTSEEFVHLLTDNLPARPEYFAREVDSEPAGCGALVGIAAARRVHRAGSSAVAEGGCGGGGHAARDAVRRGARAGVGSHRPHRAVRFVGGANSGAGHAPDHCGRRSRTRARVAVAPGPRRTGECGRIPGGGRGRLDPERLRAWSIFPKSRFRSSSNCGNRSRTGSPCWTCVSRENGAAE